MSIVGICHLQRHLACGRASDATKVILSGLFANLRVPCLIEGRGHIYRHGKLARHTHHTPHTLYIPHLVTPQKKKGARVAASCKNQKSLFDCEMFESALHFCCTTTHNLSVIHSFSQLVIRSFTQLASRSVMLCSL